MKKKIKGLFDKNGIQLYSRDVIKFVCNDYLKCDKKCYILNKIFVIDWSNDFNRYIAYRYGRGDVYYPYFYDTDCPDFAPVLVSRRNTGILSKIKCLAGMHQWHPTDNDWKICEVCGKTKYDL